MESGIAARPIEDLEGYRERLDSSMFRSALMMRPVFEASRTGHRRIVFAEGEDVRVLRAAHGMRELTTDAPILLGRPEVILGQAQEHAIPINADDYEIINPVAYPRYDHYCQAYFDEMKRRGVTPDLARAVMRTNSTAIGAVMVREGDADSMICGTFGQYLWHLGFVTDILGTFGMHPVGALSLLILESGPLFVADTHIHVEPSAEEIARITVGAARHVRRFGLEPKIALCSHSQFGNLDKGTGPRMREALAILDGAPRDFVYEGEMNSDVALDAKLRTRYFPESRLEGEANVLIFANTDAASGVRNILKAKGQGLEVGPILMGMGNQAHIVTPSITPRGLINIAALAGTPVQQYA